METTFLRVYAKKRHFLPDRAKGKAFTATQLLSAVQKRTGQKMTLRTLQWYGTVGLIEKPAKKGRQASYPRHVLDELWGAKVLQIDYKLTVDGLLKLRKEKISPFLAAYCLSQIRDKYLQRRSTPKISALLTRIGQKFKEMDRQILGFWDEPVTATVSRGDWQEMWKELSHRAGVHSLGGQLDKDLRQITDEFFSLMDEGNDPLRIDLYSDDLKKQVFPED
jgi:hypothetical protein